MKHVVTTISMLAIPFAHFPWLVAVLLILFFYGPAGLREWDDYRDQRKNHPPGGWL